jgi:hypothetical protein
MFLLPLFGSFLTLVQSWTGIGARWWWLTHKNMLESKSHCEFNFFRQTFCILKQSNHVNESVTILIVYDERLLFLVKTNSMKWKFWWIAKVKYSDKIFKWLKKTIVGWNFTFWNIVDYFTVFFIRSIIKKTWMFFEV